MARYAELCDGFRWQVPEHFNIAQACCGRWAAGPSRRALYWEDESGAQAQLSFQEVQLATSHLSALRRLSLASPRALQHPAGGLRPGGGGPLPQHACAMLK